MNGVMHKVLRITMVAMIKMKWDGDGESLGGGGGVPELG